MKKSEIFLRKPLDFPRENSIIGLTLGDEGRRPREAAGQLEGIGDVLSDGPRKFLGSLLRKTGQAILKINDEFDPGSERTLVACLIHASRAT